MSIRTTVTAVIKVLGNDYGPKFDGSLPDINPYIETASNLVDQMLTNARAKGYIHTTTQLELIERWTAAYCYTKMDPTYSTRSTGGASGGFIRGKEEPEPYKDMATALDGSGCLNALLNRRRASLVWLGKVPSEQIPYDQRD